MTLYGCAREAELMSAIRDGHWPAACDPSLRDHVRECRSCTQAALLAVTLHNSRLATGNAARLAAPGLLFWRAQLRRRNQAFARIDRPIFAAELLAIFLTVGALAIIIWQWAGNAHHDFAARISNSLGAVSQWMTSADGLIWTVVVCTSALVALFGAFAVYVIASRE